MKNPVIPHHIVIVGGGAGGLELATGLGDALAKYDHMVVTLVDQCETHLWKPLLHEVAAGSMDIDEHELEYMAQARWHCFNFRLGAMEGLNRTLQEIYIAPVYDDEGTLLIPRRSMRYDTLVIAVGSVSNDFGIPGVAEFSISLDSHADAVSFHKRLMHAYIRAQTQTWQVSPGGLDVAIIGGGATGIELSAELHKTTRLLAAYGFDRIDPEHDIHLSIIEASHRLLPALPEYLSSAVQRQLADLGVAIHLGKKVVKVDQQGVYTSDGGLIPARLVVWAAGIKAPDFLRQADGLEVNAANQLVVRDTLQTTYDDHVFAFGDCAACTWSGKSELVPPRAQAAHQQASLLLKSLKRHILRNKPLLTYRYVDFGSLVNLGHYTTVGNLMGGIAKGEVFIEGLVARFIYRSLYRMHLYALHGLCKVVMDTLAQWITRRGEQRIKLH